MAQYSLERKQAILNKLLSPELISIAQLARDEHGVCQHSCHPYLNQATKTSLALTRLDRRTGLRAVG